MIITGLLNIIYIILDKLLIFSIPQLPEVIEAVVIEVFMLCATGASIVGMFVPLDVAFLLFGIIVAIDLGLGIYKFVMWILRKIPVLGIS